MIYQDLPMGEYLAHPGIGSSLLRKILVTPADFKAAQRKKFNDTKATILGTAIHTIILEPKEFDNRYLCQTEDWGNKAKNPGKKLWDTLKAQGEASGKIVLGFDDYEKLQAIAAAAKQIPELQFLLDHGKVEVTAYTSDTPGFSLKARTDLLSLTLDGSEPCCWDVKSTCENLDDEKIAKIIFDNGYHFQGAHHLSVFKTKMPALRCFGWIFVSTQDDHAHMRIVQAPQEFLACGFRDYDIALKKLIHCIAKDEWPGHETIVTDLQIPAFYKRIYE